MTTHPSTTGRSATAGGLEKMVGLTYARLRELAGGYFRRERPDHTLQPTALVHEAYLRLRSAERRRWDSRAHFLSFAARAMRQVLIDEARKRLTHKRRRQGARMTIAADPALAQPQAVDLLDLDRALSELSARDPRKAELVELRCFGGLSIEEAAEVLGLSVATVNREWRAARAWLARALGPPRE
jgi:RNA polymerase sigma factor (TIGR02999 family)